MTHPEPGSRPPAQARRALPALALALAAALTAGGPAAQAQPVTADYIVVVVNRDSVTATELMPSSFTFLTRSEGRMAPSSSEYVECRCR